ncbi:ATP-dependent zinc protease [Planctomycetales bacterium ZRK34]|nr:ATP-dependent zinc protease [Planctomycetales bacterium ZRK34]
MDNDRMASGAVDKTMIGWREWVSLPQLGISEIKAKIDTGARTSALHAWDIEHFQRDGVRMVRFKVHPIQRDTRQTVITEAPLIEHRHVRSSSGDASRRPVIMTQIQLMGRTFDIELTLTNRDAMGFRMLLGRQALRGRGRFTIDPGRSYLAGKRRVKKKKKKIKKIKRKPRGE